MPHPEDPHGGFLQKPYVGSTLAAALRELIDRRSNV
jgi:hypothetical protein